MRAWPSRRPARGRKAPAAFLDRDGTLNRDKAGVYITSPEQLKLYAGVPAALKKLSAKGYRLVVLTNQSGVARGYMTLGQARRINLKLVRDLRAAGVKLDAVYFCPHGPDDGCACRKPAPGLIKEALKELAIDLEGSFVAGDKASDLALAKAAGIRGMLVLTGQGRAAGAKGYGGLAALAGAVPDVNKGKEK
jgi:histidinol-phosphate phosphatase family protein